MTKRLKQGKAHFRLNFEWFTDYARSLWAEGEYVLAITIITDNDIPVGEAHDIIRGKRKMVQDPEGGQGIAGLIVNDNWTPDLVRCIFSKYPDPLDLGYFRMVNKYGVKGLTDMYRDIERAARSMNEATNYFDKLEIVKQVHLIPDDVFQFFDVPRPETIGTGDFSSTALYNIGLNRAGQEVEPIRLRAQIAAEIRAQAMEDLRDDDMAQLDPVRAGVVAGLPSVDEYVKKQLELDKRPKPEPDQEFSNPTGYVLPNGKFYSCEWMEHSWLAFVLGDFGVQDARKAGWIMISHPLGQPRDYHIYDGDEEPTQAQIDTLDSWRQKYGEYLKHDYVAKETAVDKLTYKPAARETAAGEFTPDYGED